MASELGDILIKSKKVILELKAKNKQKDKKIGNLLVRIESLTTELKDSESLHIEEKEHWLDKEKYYLGQIKYLNDEYSLLKSGSFGRRWDDYIDLYIEGGVSYGLVNNYGFSGLLCFQVNPVNSFSVGIKGGWVVDDLAGVVYAKYRIF